MSLYEEVGGAPTFERLVHAFYEGVAGDAELRALYPEATTWPPPSVGFSHVPHPSTSAARRRYSEERGHPRLRMRHAPYPVTLDMRDRWMRHMLAAMDTLDLPEVQAEQMRDY